MADECFQTLFLQRTGNSEKTLMFDLTLLIKSHPSFDRVSYSARSPDVNHFGIEPYVPPCSFMQPVIIIFLIRCFLVKRCRNRHAHYHPST